MFLLSFHLQPGTQEIKFLGVTEASAEVAISHETSESESSLISGQKKNFLSLQALEVANQAGHHQIACEERRRQRKEN